MAITMSKNKFVVEASIQLAAGESAYGGGTMNAERVVANAEELFDALVNEGHIEKIDNPFSKSTGRNNDGS